MFPKFAILVVDRNLFGEKCNLFSEYENAQEQTFNVGFLVIQSSKIDGLIVSITGVPTIFDAIFEQQTTQYQMNSTGDGSRRLVTISTPIEVKMPSAPADNPILPFQILFMGEISKNTDNVKKLQVTSELVRTGIFSVWYLKFDWTGEVVFHFKMKYLSSIKFSNSFQCPGETWCSNMDWDLIPSIPFPYLSFPFPDFILNLLLIDGLVS
jgi:hypothetical protein